MFQSDCFQANAVRSSPNTSLFTSSTVITFEIQLHFYSRSQLPPITCRNWHGSPGSRLNGWNICRLTRWSRVKDTQPFCRIQTLVWETLEHFCSQSLPFVSLFNRDALHFSKVTVETFIMSQKISVSYKCCFLFIKKSRKIKCITKILCSTTVFNIDNNQKCFFDHKSVYYYDFWRSCDAEDWSNDAENTALITETNYTLTIYSHRKLLF